MESGVGRRVVVTGMGVVSPIGQRVAEFWAGIKQAKSGVGPIDSFPQNDPHILRSCQIKDFKLNVLIAAQVKGFDKHVRLKHFKRDKIIAHADRYSLFAAVAADEAVKQSGLEVPLSNPLVTYCLECDHAKHTFTAFRQSFGITPASHIGSAVIRGFLVDEEDEPQACASGLPTF